MVSTAYNLDTGCLFKVNQLSRYYRIEYLTEIDDTATVVEGNPQTYAN